MSFIRQGKRRFLIPVFIIILAILSGLILTKCSRSKVTSEIKQPAVLVKTLSAKEGSFSPTLIVYAQAISSRRIPLSAKVSADVQQVRITDGQQVKAGQLLLTFDDDDAVAAFDRAKKTKEADEATLQSQQTILTNKKADFARKRKLFNDKRISDKMFEDSQSALHQQQISVDQQKAKLSQATESLTLAKKTLTDHSIVAPMDAVVTHVYVSSHEPVTIGQKLIQLLPTDEIEVRGLVPVPYLDVLQRAISHGDKIKATSMYASRPLLFHLTHIAARVNSGQIGREAVFKADNVNSTVVDGQHFTLRLILPAQSGVIKLPLSALYYNNVVYKVVDSRLQAVSVNVIGRIYGQRSTMILVQSSADLPSCVPIVVSSLSDPINGQLVRQNNSKDAQCQ